MFAQSACSDNLGMETRRKGDCDAPSEQASGDLTVETFSRILAGELGANGIRVICLRSDAIPEALATSHAREVFSGFARRAAITVEEMLAQRALTGTLLKRFPTFAEVGNFAAMVAANRASAMTGAIANLTCGTLVD